VLDNLKLSVSNLWDEFGQTDDPVVGVTVSLALACLGVVAIILSSSTAVQLVAVVWVVLNLWGPLAWVMGL